MNIKKNIKRNTNTETNTDNTKGNSRTIEMTTAEKGALVIKVVLVAVLLLFLFFVYRGNSAKDVPVKDIETALVKQTNIEKIMEPCGDRDLLQFMGLDYRDYDSYVYYKTSEALGVDELLIVKVKNKSDLTGVEDAVDKRVSSQITKFDSYGPSQVRELNNAIIEKKGKYLFYCAAKSPEKYEEVFRDAI